MKKILVVFFCLMASSMAWSQVYNFNLEATAVKKYDKFKKGDVVKISGLSHSVEVQTRPTDGVVLDTKDVYTLIANGDSIKLTGKIDDALQFSYFTPDEFWNANILTKVLPVLTKKGTQEPLRAEMESDALQYIQTVKAKGWEFNDPFLESYIYSLIAKIAPSTLIDGRPGSINLLIQETPEMNAGMYPNGTLVINTGLIAALHSEDELVAILSHEIAHFVLDHSVHNVNAAIARQKRAEFWAALATGVTAVAEAAAASKNNNYYYVPGVATIAMAQISTEIANQVVNRLGMKYNNEQETEADECAVKIIKLLGYDENALATALSRMQELMNVERKKSMYFASYSHPALVDRIGKAGVPKQLSGKEYERMVSFAVTSTARLKFEDRRFRQSIEYCTQNISNGVATSEDYILRANNLLFMKSDKISNNEVLELLAEAKALDPSNINIYKSEIIAKLRLGEKSDALALLEEYVDRLKTMSEESASVENEELWASVYFFVEENEDWAKRMITKLQGM